MSNKQILTSSLALSTSIVFAFPLFFPFGDNLWFLMTVDISGRLSSESLISIIAALISSGVGKSRDDPEFEPETFRFFGAGHFILK